MRKYTLIILIAVLALYSCNKSQNHPSKSESEILSVADSLWILSLDYGDQQENWKALYFAGEAKKRYDSIDNPLQTFNKYLLLRHEAKLLYRVNAFDSASKTMEKSLSLLRQAKSAIEDVRDFDIKDTTRSDYKTIKGLKKINYNKEEVSTLRFLVSYYIKNHEVDKSNEIIKDLLTQYEQDPPFAPGLNSTLRNRWGRNLYEVQAYSDAVVQYDLALKPESIDAKLKAQVLQNRAWALFHLSRIENRESLKEEAFKNMIEARDINLSFGEDRNLYKFVSTMDLGEMYDMDFKFGTAVTYYDEALSYFNQVYQDPDLFRIYDLRYNASKSLLDAGSIKDKRLYDSLKLAHDTMIDRLSSDQVTAKIKAASDEVQIARNSLPWYEDIPEWMVIAAFVIVGILAFILSSRIKVGAGLSRLDNRATRY